MRRKERKLQECQLCMLCCFYERRNHASKATGLPEMSSETLNNEKNRDVKSDNLTNLHVLAKPSNHTADGHRNFGRVRVFLP